MIRIWGKVIRNNKIILDEVATSDKEENYEEAVKDCINELCEKFDIGKPYWLETNIREFNKRRKTTFNNDNFIEDIEFDRFIVEVLEEEDKSFKF
jgi:hypothetical protein